MPDLTPYRLAEIRTHLEMAEADTWRDTRICPWSDIRDLLAALDRDPWRRTAEEKPPFDGSKVVGRTKDGSFFRVMWSCDGWSDYSLGTRRIWPADAFPHWMPMDALPKPRGAV